MEFSEVIEKRFSCREFKDESIKKEELDKILNAALLAPTACNKEPQRIYVVEDIELLLKLKEATRFTFDSKTILVVCYDKDISWHRGRDAKDHGEIDATIAATQMVLEATNLGIGSCFVCAFNEEVLRSILNIPQNYGIMCMLPLGYPKVISPHNTRGDISNLVIYK